MKYFKVQLKKGGVLVSTEDIRSGVVKVRGCYDDVVGPFEELRFCITCEYALPEHSNRCGGLKDETIEAEDIEDLFVKAKGEPESIAAQRRSVYGSTGSA